jgi:hypothetical protein
MVVRAADEREWERKNIRVDASTVHKKRRNIGCSFQNGELGDKTSQKWVLPFGERVTSNYGFVPNLLCSRKDKIPFVPIHRGWRWSAMCGKKVR